MQVNDKRCALLLLVHTLLTTFLSPDLHQVNLILTNSTGTINVKRAVYIFPGSAYPLDFLEELCSDYIVILKWMITEKVSSDKRL